MSQLSQLIPIINKLQDVLAVVGSSAQNVIDLPQITVVGSQSAGKSSVLENIVGHEILPRGSGIVTRRPLILQLYNTNSMSQNKVTGPDGKEATEWGEFLHLPNKRFTSWDAIRHEIERVTDEVAGSNKGVSGDPIRLKIYSDKLLNLTLVDLPGIAKVPVGDQPKDIEQQIRKMVLQFISRPNAIILAVTAGNTDIATSDALQLAREVDPDFTRTVGVLTKLDLMDRGTDAGEILHNHAHPLRLGWIGVVNRSQADINANKSIEAALKSEEEFFAKTPAYRDIASRQGTAYLARQLNEILISHIQRTLPDLRRKVQEQLTRVLRELEGLGGQDIPDDNRQAFLLQLINQYAADFTATIEGRSQGAAKSELFGGARISYVFTEVLGKMIASVNQQSQLKPDEIRTLIRNASGPTPTLFLPDFAFQLLANRMIAELEGPCLRVLDLVFEELTRIARNVPSPSLRRFAAFRNAIVDTACGLLRKLREPTKVFIQDLIKCELSYTNTRHPHFVGGSGALNLVEAQKASVRTATAPDAPSVDAAPTQDGSVPGQLRPSGEFSESDRFAIEILPRLLDSYYQIVRVKIQDSIPKALMYFLVDRSKEQMQTELVQSLYRPDRVDQLLIEDETVVRRRKLLREQLTALRAASDVLDEVRDISVTGPARAFRPSGPAAGRPEDKADSMGPGPQRSSPPQGMGAAPQPPARPAAPQGTGAPPSQPAAFSTRPPAQNQARSGNPNLLFAGAK